MDLRASPLAEADAARARGRAYAILARLLVRGLDETTLGSLRELGGWLLEGLGETIDLDELAAEHHAVVHLNVFPYAGVFLDPSARAGAKDELVREHFEGVGFRPRLDELAADQLGVMVGFLAWVSSARAEALEDGHDQLAARLDYAAAGFLDECVLSWLPVLVVASEELARVFWPGVLRAVLELAADHRRSMSRPRGGGPRLVELGDWLADERTGLRRIAEHLLCPAESGVFLTRADVEALARGRELPRGFGSRVIMLENLLRGAAELDGLPALIEDLDVLLARRERALADVAEVLSLAPELAPWRQALQRTRATLQILTRQDS